MDDIRTYMLRLYTDSAADRILINYLDTKKNKQQYIRQLIENDIQKENIVTTIRGGMTKAAKKDYINQAETVADSQNINIITKKQYKKLISNEKNQNNDNKTGSGKININSADVAELTGLSGIGEAKAKAIIQYRNENGNFNNIEDIKNVSGIGDALFKKISNEITAN